MDKKAALYARFSSDNQRIESIDAQLRACREYCKRKGYEIENEYTDEALSARTDDRPAFQQMIHDAKAGLFNVLICHKIDRFSRDRYDYAHYKRMLNVAGVTVEYVDQHIDGSNESIMLESVLTGMAEYYSKNLAREVKKGLNENAYSAKWNGGVPPLGYDVGPDQKLVINENEASIVRMMFQMRADGATYSDIIATATAAGGLSKRGKPLKATGLHEIFANEKYIGVYIFGRVATPPAGGKTSSHKSNENAIRIEGAIPRIIDDAIWTRVRGKSYKQQRQSNQKEIYLLSGLVRCECGGPMAGSRVVNQNGYPYVYYRCNKNKANPHNCGNGRIKKEALEDFVLKSLSEQIGSAEGRKTFIDNLEKSMGKMLNEDAAEAEKLKNEIIDLDKRAGNLLEMIENGQGTSILGARLEEIGNRQVAIRGRLLKISQRQKSMMSRENIDLVLQGYANELTDKKNSPDRIRALLAILIESVTVKKSDIILDIRFSADLVAPSRNQNGANHGGVKYKWQQTYPRRLVATYNC